MIKLPKMIIVHAKGVPEEFTAYLEDTGIVVSAETREQAIRELMTSVMCQLCFEAGEKPPLEINMRRACHLNINDEFLLFGGDNRIWSFEKKSGTAYTIKSGNNKKCIGHSRKVIPISKFKKDKGDRDDVAH